jgi:hypothetical protein
MCFRKLVVGASNLRAIAAAIVAILCVASLTWLAASTDDWATAFDLKHPPHA